MLCRWDACNKWLYLGKQEKWIIQLDEWLNWFPLNQLSIRSWSFFRIIWDNGNWWAFDMENAINLNDKKYGELGAFFEITICGVGVRRNYSKKVVFVKKQNKGDQK